MINETLYRTTGIRTVAITIDDFVRVANSQSVLMVRTKDEKDYWLGMQLIEGIKYHVVYEGDEEDWKKAHPQFSTFCTYYHTHDPLTRDGTAYIPLKLWEFI